MSVFSQFGWRQESRLLSERTRFVRDEIPRDGPTICLDTTYGRNFNMVITLANAIEYANRMDGVVVLANKQWDQFFHMWFKTSHVPKVYRRPGGYRCDITHDASSHYFSRTTSFKGEAPFQGNFRPQYNYLSLRKSVLNRGRDVLNSYRHSPDDPVVTVHQRWLEGECFERHAKGDGCFGSTAYNFTCEYSAAIVEQHLPPEYRNASIILLGDGQRKDTESTFVHIDKHPFPVQAAMMVESDYHFGNPVSSVDGVIAHWRKGKRQFPEPCYQEITSNAGAMQG